VTEATPARYLWLAAGFTIWAVAFVVLYTIQALGCAFDWPLLAHRGALALALAAHLAGLAGLVARARRGEAGDFLHVVTLWTLWAALVSTALTYAPALFLTACV
jgi:hypothetical protein